MDEKGRKIEFCFHYDTMLSPISIYSITYAKTLRLHGVKSREFIIILRGKTYLILILNHAKVLGFFLHLLASHGYLHNSRHTSVFVWNKIAALCELKEHELSQVVIKETRQYLKIFV